MRRSTVLGGLVGVLALAWVAAPAAGVADAPSLAVTPERGAPGDLVRASGENWSPDRGPVRVYADEDQVEAGQPLGEQQPDGEGAIDLSFKLPELEPGARTFYACQLCTESEGVPEARDDFEVTAPPEPAAVVVLSRDSARVGESVVVSGEGWSAALGSVTLALTGVADGAVTTLPVAPAPDPVSGAFETAIDVPRVTAGSYVLTACQGCSNPEARRDATAPLVVISPPAPALTPTLTPTPATGRPGETVSLSGSGWSPRDGDVSLFVDRSLAGGPGSRLLTTTPGPRGRIVRVPVEVPDMAPRTYRWYACQRCGDPDGPPGVTVAFTVGRAPAISPELALAPAGGEAGTSVEATGSGWLPDRGEVWIFADRLHLTDPSRLLASAAVLPDGSFATQLEIPEGTPARAELFACQDCGAAEGYPAATASFTVEPAGSDGRLLLVAVAVAVAGFAALSAVVVARRRPGRRRERTRAPATVRPELRAGTDPGFRAAGDHEPGERPSLRLVPHDAALTVLDPPEER